MPKPTIFLSHIHEEGELARLIGTDLINEHLMNGVDVFVSSDPQKNASGQSWLRNVENRLVECSALFILASPRSIERPWINIEAGAGWLRFLQSQSTHSVPSFAVVPLCHSGLRPEKLPLPWQTFNALTLSSADDLQQVLEISAPLAGLSRKPPDLKDLIARIVKIEERYIADIANGADALRVCIEEKSRLQRALDKRPEGENPEVIPEIICTLEGRASTNSHFSMLIKLINAGACGVVVEEIDYIWKVEGGDSMRSKVVHDNARPVFIKSGEQTGLLQLNIPSAAILDSLGSLDDAAISTKNTWLTVSITATSKPYGRRRIQTFVLSGERLDDGRSY